jgi:hypothetical protein
MRKNWIIWKRTWCASLCELICPVALMAILTIARSIVSIDHIDQMSMIPSTTIYYPPVNSSTNLTVVQSQINTLYSDFYKFSNVSAMSVNPFVQFANTACFKHEFKERTILALGPNNSISWQVANYFQTTSKISGISNHSIYRLTKEVSSSSTGSNTWCVQI